MKMSKMTWIMIACCAVVLGAFVLLPALGVRLGGFAPLLILLCPLAHIGMMAFMGGHKHDSSRSHCEVGEKEQSEKSMAERPRLELTDAQK